VRRVHIDDLTGFVSALSDEWDVLSLPAIAEHDEVIQLWGGKTHYRRAGEALSPDREPLGVLEGLKRQLGSEAFSAQYQQQPAPPGGAMIKRHWIKRYKELPTDADRVMTLQSWDTASKGGPDNDWSVCTTWVLTRNKLWYLAHVWRRRVDYPGLKSSVQALSREFKARRVLVEDAGAGTSLVQELKGKVSGIIAVRPEGDKKSRMAVASARFEAGEILLPEQASWLPDFESELFTFPASKHYDQCDSVSQALLDTNHSFWALLTPEEWDKILAKASIPQPGSPAWRLRDY
jgi:predicted phage terminase large subunit-like protein